MPRWLLRRLPIAFALLAAVPVSAGMPDWASLGEVDTVLVTTADADGEPRETTVWLAVVDGTGYVRTGTSTWGENAARSGELVLHAGEAAFPLRVELVEDDALRQRITDAFRAKYGVSDWMVSWVRGSRPRIMRLLPKE